MTHASMWEAMSPELCKVAERARQEPDGQFHSLAHLIDVAALERAYDRLRNKAAVGVDGITKEAYGEKLQANLKDLHERMKARRYRHQPILRVHIPKGKGKTRPIGISTTEDKIVQGALKRAADQGRVNWVLEADIQSFFDSLDRPSLKEMLQVRIADGSMHRLVGKCLHVGVLDGVEFSRPDEGTAQGSVVSPLLGNIYLHYALDAWFEREVKPRLRGKATLIRYADDFVIGFEQRLDAERVMDVLPKRMARYGLTLHPDKTRLIPFERPPREQQGGKGPRTFDFLGFTWYWGRDRNGRWRVACKTRRARLKRAIQAVDHWCRSHRHWKVPAQHAALCRRIRGHMNYFGVNGNSRSLQSLVYHAERAWLKWLRRRSQRTRLNWDRFKDLLRAYPLPPARICVKIWE